MSARSSFLAVLLAELAADPDAAREVARVIAPHLPAGAAPGDSAGAVGPAPSPYLSTAEAAELLRTTPGRVRQLTHSGRLPVAARDGRRVLIARDDLACYLDDGR
jgi:excisionase family DNA binding protein